MSNKQVVKPTILYVDDSEPNLILFRELFKDDYHIILAESAKKGLEILRKEEVKVLVSDQSMPGMSGNELLEIVSEEFPELLSFILTAYTDYDSLVESVNRGKIYGYFNKPIKYEEIKIALNKAVEVSRLRERNKKMLMQLEKANLELLALDKSRTKFLSMVTEEIRSPVNKIMSAIHMIKDKIDSEDITELLNLVDISISRLESFTYATNQLTRIRDDKISIDKQEVSLRELIEITFINKKNSFDEAGISARMDKDSSGAFVMGDYDLLLSCLGVLVMNLMNNTDQGASFIFSAFQNNDSSWMEITVENSGFSATEIENLERIFSCSSNIPGNYASLELILSREIIKTHQGEVHFKSGENGFFTTRLSFPGVTVTNDFI